MKTFRLSGWFANHVRVRGMSALCAVVVAAMWIGGVSAGQNASAQSGAKPHIVKLVINGEIEPILADYVTAGLNRAAEFDENKPLDRKSVV